MTRHHRTLRMSAFVALLLGMGASYARADNPRRITLLTQNLYQGTELQHALSAQTQMQFVLGVAADYQNVIATDFPQRADALAAEIAQAGPALVGLEEVALWRTQFPYNPAALPQTVSYDFLQILLDALAAHGMHYTTVAEQANYDVSGPGLFSFGLMGVRLTDRNVILARTDLATDLLQLSNPQQGSYQHIGVIHTLGGPVSINGSWLSVDAKTRGKTFRLITTHLLGPVLDGSPDPILPLQAQEVLDGPASTDLPAIVMGDLNSTPGDPAHVLFAGAGFIDEWDAANPTDPGFTAFQVRPGISNPVSTLSSRIDDVLARGLFAPLDLHLIGADPSARTASGLWPSDHAGVVATIEIGPQPGLTANGSTASSLARTIVSADHGLPGAPWLAPVAPNPVRARSELRFALPRASRVDLALFDAQGRRVRNLLSGVFDAGEHSVRWDGLDEAGRPMNNGLYFARLDAEGTTALSRFVLLH